MSDCGRRLLALVLLTLAGGPALADRIDPFAATTAYGTGGLEIVARHAPLDQLFRFAPLAASDGTVVPGFSDPLGTGLDPQFKLFAGAVQFMDLLGDYHPVNPFDPDDAHPTQESLQSAAIINMLLYGNVAPNEKSLVNSQLNLEQSSASERSRIPSTTETSPLSLAGFGSVTEYASPANLHWTHCPDYNLSRFLFSKSSSPRSAAKAPPRDCFVM